MMTWALACSISVFELHRTSSIWRFHNYLVELLDFATKISRCREALAFLLLANVF